jgi:hypothetical protein
MSTPKLTVQNVDLADTNVWPFLVINVDKDFPSTAPNCGEFGYYVMFSPDNTIALTNPPVRVIKQIDKSSPLLQFGPSTNTSPND